MQQPRRSLALTSLRALGRTCTTTAVVLALGASLGTVGLSSARADTLDDQQQRLNNAIAVSQRSLEGNQKAASQASASLDHSQGQLEQRRSVLAEAQAAWGQAADQDVTMAARLSASQEALKVATKKVADNQIALDAELKLASATLSNLQQRNPLEPVAIFTNDLNPGDVNQRSQWAQQSATMTQAQALRLAELQRQLRDARAAQVTATAAVADQRQQAADHLAQTAELKQTAQAQAAAVAAPVRPDAAKAGDAQARLAAEQEQAASLRQQSANVNQKIAARNEAIRQAQIKAAREAAARAEAARAAAAKAAAARAAAEEAARQADASAAAAANRAASQAEARAAVARQATRTSSSSDSDSSNSGSSSRRTNYSMSNDVSGYSNRVAGSEVDPWGFYSYECVSYAAYMVRTTTSWNDFVNNYSARGASVHFGNAVEWAAAARGIGVPVNTSPSVGSVAWRSSGRAGHVAMVTAVHSDGTIDIAEYNLSGGYHQFGIRSRVDWTSGGTWGFDGFIHFEA